MNPAKFVGVIATILLLCSLSLFAAGYLRAIVRGTWWEPCNLLRWGAWFMLAAMGFVMVSAILFPQDLGVERGAVVGVFILGYVTTAVVMWFRKRHSKSQ